MRLEQARQQVLEFGVAVEDSVRNEILFGKGDIETVPLSPPNTEFGRWIMEGLLCGSVLRMGCQ